MIKLELRGGSSSVMGTQGVNIFVEHFWRMIPETKYKNFRFMTLSLSFLMKFEILSRIK